MPDGTSQGTAMLHFDPTDDNHRMFRDALGRFSSGVTIVTANTPEGPVGMTANSFTSVSMEPPLVLWCPAKSSSRYALFADATDFAIHVLEAKQKELALAFARSGTAFDAVDTARSDRGVPVFDSCLARFECETYGFHDAGDHSIMVGLVRHAAFRQGAPLIFSQGTFGRFDKEVEKANV